MKHETREHKEMKQNFQKRAYKELLEYCSDHILGQVEENDPSRREAFKMLYTLDGAPLKTLDDVRNYCQEEKSQSPAKQLMSDKMMRQDSSTLSDRFISPYQDDDLRKVISQNKASFVISPLQKDLKMFTSDKDANMIMNGN